MRGRAPLRIITRHPACATASQTRAGQARGSSERVQALCGPRSGASGTHPHRSAGARGPAPQRRAGGRPCGFCVHAPPSCGRSSPAGQRRAGRRAPRSHRHCAPAPMRRGSCNGEELHSVCCQQRSTFLLLLTLHTATPLARCSLAQSEHQGSFRAQLEAPRPVVTYAWRRGSKRDAANLEHLLTYILSLYSVTLCLEHFEVRAGCRTVMGARATDTCPARCLMPPPTLPLRCRRVGHKSLPSCSTLMW